MPKEKKPFVDFRAIRSRITMEQVLEHYGVLDTFKRTGNRLSGPCPIHNGNNPTQFRVDVEKNIWNCFSECKQGGNVLDFIAKKEEVPIHEAAIKACEWFGIPVSEIKSTGSIQQHTGDSQEIAAKASAKQQSSSLTNQAPAPQEEDAPNPPLKFRLEKLHKENPYLMEQRGLSLETITHFGLGFFTGEKGLMVGRVVIPIHNLKGELVAYAGRWPGEAPKDTPKYKLPPGFRKGLELFNADQAFKEPQEEALVIVEGFFDAIKLHQHGYRKVVALMGSSMSIAQETIIQQHSDPSSRVIVMLDEDAAGQAAREEIATRLAKFCFVRIKQFEKPGAQPEHLTAPEVQRLCGGEL